MPNYELVFKYKRSNLWYSINFRYTKRSHHSYGFNQPETGISNDSDKDACCQNNPGLHKTWLNITKSIQDIKRDLERIRQGFVTLSLPKQINVRIRDIENSLFGIQDAIVLQQKLISYEYPLGDILKTVKLGRN